MYIVNYELIYKPLKNIQQVRTECNQARPKATTEATKIILILDKSIIRKYIFVRPY